MVSLYRSLATLLICSQFFVPAAWSATKEHKKERPLFAITEKLRQAFKKEVKHNFSEDIAASLQVSTKPVLDSSTPTDKTMALEDAVHQQLLDPEGKSFLLLLGNSQSGKTSYGRLLEHQLWGKWEGADSIIPIFISLPKEFKALEKKEMSDQLVIDSVLHQKGLDSSEINLLKNEINVLFFLDGHEQMENTHRNFSLYESQNLKDWKKARFIISTDTKSMENPEELNSLFPTAHRDFAEKLYTVPLPQEDVVEPTDEEELDELSSSQISIGLLKKKIAITYPGLCKIHDIHRVNDHTLAVEAGDSGNRKLYLVHVKSGRQIEVAELSSVQEVQSINNDTLAVTAGSYQNRTLHLVNIESGEQRLVPDLHGVYKLHRVNDHTLAIAVGECQNRTLHLVNIESGEQRLLSDLRGVCEIRGVNTQTLAVTAGSYHNRSLHLVNIESGEQRPVSGIKVYDIHRVNDDTLAVTAGSYQNRTLHLVEVSSGSQQRVSALSRVYKLHRMNDQTLAVACGNYENQTLHLVNVKNGDQRPVPGLCVDDIHRVNDQTLAVTVGDSHNQTLHLVNIESGEQRPVSGVRVSKIQQVNDDTLAVFVESHERKSLYMVEIQETLVEMESVFRLRKEVEQYLQNAQKKQDGHEYEEAVKDYRSADDICRNFLFSDRNVRALRREIHQKLQHCEKYAGGWWDTSKNPSQGGCQIQ